MTGDKTAGDMRAAGIKVSEDIPDCAVATMRAPYRVKSLHHGDGAGEIVCVMSAEWSFRWVEITGISCGTKA